MRDLINTVYELADLGITIVPLKPQTGPINTAMGRLLWAIQAWYAEMENEDRSENVKSGQARARAQGKEIGRPREIGAVKCRKMSHFFEIPLSKQNPLRHADAAQEALLSGTDEGHIADSV